MELSMRSRLGLLLAAFVGMSLVAQAAMMVVDQDESTEMIRGERFDLSTALHVSESSIDVVPADADAEGTSSNPVELAGNDPDANTELVQDHWMYTVVLEEETASALASGQFEVELLLSGDGKENEPVGSVYVKQGTGDSGSVEGATISWDLGSDLPENPLFVIKTHPHTPAGDTREITLQSDWDATTGGYVWKGVGGTIDGQTNPDITVEAGTTVTFTIRHGCSDDDTAPHNFYLRDGSDNVVASSDDVTSCGDEETVTWTAPDTAGEYSYQCDYHPSTMQGSLTVTEDGSGDGSVLPGTETTTARTTAPASGGSDATG